MKDPDFTIRKVTNGYIVFSAKDQSEHLFLNSRDMGEWLEKLDPTPEPLAPTE